MNLVELAAGHICYSDVLPTSLGIIHWIVYVTAGAAALIGEGSVRALGIALVIASFLSATVHASGARHGGSASPIEILATFVQTAALIGGPVLLIVALATR